MSQRYALSGMDAVALVEATIKNHALFKGASDALERMQPDAQAAQLLITAFDHLRCPAWLAGCLLGCIGHEIGYQTAKKILLSKAGLLSETYAAVAMAKIRGVAAYDDLREIAFGNHPRKIRQGALRGMATTSAPQLLNDLFAAFKEQRLSRKDLSWHAAECNPTDDWLLDLLRSDDLQQQKLACAIVEMMVAPNSTHRIPGKHVATTILRLIDDPKFSINPQRRDNLLAWSSAT